MNPLNSLHCHFVSVNKMDSITLVFYKTDNSNLQTQDLHKTET